MASAFERESLQREIPWARRNPNAAAPTGQPGLSFAPTTPAASAPADPFAMFNDPSTNFLTQVIKGQIGDLGRAPATDPTTSGLMDFLKAQLGKTASAAPVSFSASNGLLGDFINEGRQRITELNQRPFTDAEEAGLKTRAREDLVIQRDQARKRITEDAARRGVMPSSGIVGSQVDDLERGFTATDAKAQNDMMLWIADQIQQRKDKAAGISQSLAGAGQAEAALNMQGQIAANGANQQHDGMVMSIASTLANLAAQQRGEARARQGDILSLSTLLAELPVQRLQTAMAVLNGTGGNNIPSLFNSVATLNNSQQFAQTNAQNQQNDFLTQLTKLASYYANKK